ncbi:expressed protein [Dictyostelium purpureum]|uniref:Expressed protein n=1 Tax=Dictyostelium purpureum TaxID=5786 RepID=F0Z676_DICPU|nr:uncharacterized protein DICPUDRAFT_96226 [Dictyostelium purpureum]EGC40608.1 expressed protein [Dictyostelium purpureum]|eukprot:XP_003282944.1 expressed protein [Dictyostelium purpureum]
MANQFFMIEFGGNDTVLLQNGENGVEYLHYNSFQDAHSAPMTELISNVPFYIVRIGQEIFVISAKLLNQTLEPLNISVHQILNYEEGTGIRPISLDHFEVVQNNSIVFTRDNPNTGEITITLNPLASIN